MRESEKVPSSIEGRSR